MRHKLALNSKSAGFVVGLILTGALGQFPLTAQTNLETNAGVQFNFSTPGAGNMALGGAFLALAFDASAAYTNPAGLTTIVQPESLIEARHWNYTHRFTDHGRIDGQALSMEGMDTISGLRDGEAEDDVTGLSYVAYVYPKRDWSFAAYRHELVNFEANFSTFGAYLKSTRGRSPLGIPGSLDGRLASLRNHMEVDIAAYGGAAAYRLPLGFSVGATISYYDFSIDTRADRYLPNLLDTPDFSSDPIVNVQTQQGEDTDWGVAAGFLWESRNKTWSMGGVYRQGPDFTFQARSQPGGGEVLKFEPREQEATFHVPDVYGLGIAFRPTDALRIALDYDRILYSQLNDDLVDIFDLATISPGASAELNGFVIKDTGETHLGIEYALLKHWPVLTLRAGAWHEPEHVLWFDGTNTGFRAVFRHRGDQMHYTAGAGLALRKIQFDVAIDHSDRSSVLCLSSGFRH
jgi:long-subunit fatty acid transport protein